MARRLYLSECESAVEPPDWRGQHLAGHAHERPEVKAWFERLICKETRFRYSGFAALAAVALALALPSLAASPPGDVVGKVTVGYQGWFACTGDGAPINAWWHWSQNWSQPPSPANNAIKAWPDVRDYTTTFQTAYANLNNGQLAKLFSSWTDQSVNAQ